MAKPNISAQTLRDLLSYDPTTGLFRTRRANRNWPAGRVTGAIGEEGYTRVRVGNVYYGAHRLAWLHVYGAWPDGPIDHINGNRSDNRISNLREATVRLNSENLRKARVDSLAGRLGVSKTHKGKFSATIRAEFAGHRVQLYLGAYASADEAELVYLAAKRRLHDGCTI
jgi:hypothetical protein